MNCLHGDFVEKIVDLVELMKPETEQLLGTLEVLAHNTFIWETDKRGEFNLWNLILSEGFVDETDLELVFEHWRSIEAWGTPTSQIEGEYAPYREEREDDDWNEAIAETRQQYYQELEQTCQNLKNLKAYQLRVNQSFRYHPNFFVSLVIGEGLNDSWICLAPTVCDLCFYERDHNIYPPVVKPVNKVEDLIFTQVDAILNKLSPITIYDYYHGGYNQTHQHQIVKGIAKNKEDAIALALQVSGMVVWELNQVERTDNGLNSRRLSQFMNQLQDRTYCRISFWDISYSYEFGRTPVNDWIGTKSQAEFEYNP